MAFQPADRIILDQVLANTGNIATVEAQQANQATVASQQEILRQLTALFDGQNLLATAASQQEILQRIGTIQAGIAALGTMQADPVSGLAAIATLLAQTSNTLNQILNLLAGVFRPPSKPVALALGFPRLTLKTTGELLMATLPMLDTQVAHIPIQTLNAEGNVVPAPAGDVFTATSADATQFAAGTSLDANGNPQMDVTPMVQMNSTGVPITLSDSAGLIVDTVLATVSRDTKPTADHLNVGGVTFTTQTEPTAPGPG